jgi:hypothetical protein
MNDSPPELLQQLLASMENIASKIQLVNDKLNEQGATLKEHSEFIQQSKSGTAKIQTEPSVNLEGRIEDEYVMSDSSSSINDGVEVRRGSRSSKALRMNKAQSRLSSSFNPSNSAARAEQSSNTTTILPATSITVKEVVILPTEMVTELTLSSLQYGIDKLTHHYNTSVDNTKRLVHWMSKKVLDIIWCHEESLDTELYNDHLPDRSAMNMLSNENFLLAARRYLRTDSYAKYVTTFYKAMNKDLMNDTKFNIQGYHLGPHQKVSQIISSCSNFHDIMRKGAKKTELARYPTISWGTIANQGEFQMMFACLAPFCASFQAKITLEALKKFTKLEDFLGSLKEVNNALNKASRERAAQDTDFQEQPKLTLLFEQAKTEKSASRFAKTSFQVHKEAMRDQDVSKTPARAWIPRSEFIASKLKSIDGDNLPNSKPNPSNSDDENFNSEYDAYVKKQNDDAFQLSYFNAATAKPSVGSKYNNRVADNKPAIVKADQACWNMTYKQVCTGPCEWSHDPVKIGEKLISDFWKIYENPYLPPSFKVQMKNGTFNMLNASTPQAKSYLLNDVNTEVNQDELKLFKQFQDFMNSPKATSSPNISTAGSYDRVHHHGYSAPVGVDEEED